jgi:hypothetical protein
MLFATRGTTDMSMRAVAFSTEGVKNFLEGAMKADTQHFLSKMEGFVIQGIKGLEINVCFCFVSLMQQNFEGAAKNHQQRVSTVRGKIWAELNEGLSMLFMTDHISHVLTEIHA